MAKTMMIRFRVSRQEYERIRNAVTAKGFSTVSAYLRSLALEHDLWFERQLQESTQLIREIHKVTVKKSLPVVALELPAEGF